MINLYSRDNKTAKAWPFIYFHGDIEDTVADHCPSGVLDLVAADQSIPEDGIHTVNVYGEICIAYIWTIPTYGKKGLVVKPSDESSMFDAMEKFRKKATSI